MQSKLLVCKASDKYAEQEDATVSAVPSCCLL